MNLKASLLIFGSFLLAGKFLPRSSEKRCIYDLNSRELRVIIKQVGGLGRPGFEGRFFMEKVLMLGSKKLESLDGLNHVLNKCRATVVKLPNNSIKSLEVRTYSSKHVKMLNFYNNDISLITCQELEELEKLCPKLKILNIQRNFLTRGSKAEIELFRLLYPESFEIVFED